MAEHYIEEYLVSLGFDLDSDKGKEYKKTLDDIEKRQKSFDKDNTTADKARKDSSKQQADGLKKQNQGMLDLQKTMRSIADISKQMGSGNIFGAFLSGASGTKSAKSFLSSLGENLDGKSKTSSAKETGKANVSTAAKETGKALQAGKVSEQGLQAGITGETAGAMAGEGGLLAGAAAVAPPVAIVAAVIAAVVLIGKAVSDLTNGLSESNINIETMSKEMWITEKTAWRLNNTLTAMGKTTADLSEIALNPTLRQQFNDLQDFQSNFKLPADFESTASRWATDVGEGRQELAVANSYMKQMAGYNLEKAFDPIATAWYKYWTNVVKGIDYVFGLRTSDTATSAVSTTGLVNGANYAPNTSSYTTANTGNLTVHNSPVVNVYTVSDDPQSIGSAVSDAVGSSIDNLALIKSVSGVNR